MIIREIEFELKDGRKALLRSPREEDIEGMLEYLYISSGETDFILRYPEECKKYTPESEKKVFENWNSSENEAAIVCIVDGKIAGNCHIGWDTRIKTGHRASVAIALLREFWNLGIGTKMFEELIRIATENERILQMELEFVEGNSRARALYEKMGFKIVSVHPDAIRLKDGKLLNEYFMIKKIERNA